ncbi:MAG: hypothetical protein JSS27_14400 [Planctomycetes bacterium]|nr:hypothetical protein [Planctomycetota bacterium]
MKHFWKTASLAGLLSLTTAAPLLAQKERDNPPAAGEKEPPPAPPAPNDRPPPPPAVGEEKIVRGVVKSFGKNPDGEIDRIELEDGQDVRFPPHVGERVSKVAKTGDEIEVRLVTPPQREGDEGRRPRQRLDSIKNVKSGEAATFAPRRDQGPGERSPGEEGQRREPAEGERPRTGPADGEQPRRQGLQDEQITEIRAIRKLLELPVESNRPSDEGRPAAAGERQGPPVNRVTAELRELRRALERKANRDSNR